MGTVPRRFDHQRLKRLREQRGWSLTRAAAEAGVTEAAWRKWERDTTPRFDLGVALAAALGVDCDALLTPATAGVDTLADRL
jgi:transcriptional regulator with XRE-family HTH domain